MLTHMSPRILSFLWIAVAGAAQSLNGVIDFHAHADPDSTARSIDALDLAKLAKTRGMRGLVLKNHWEPTASLAYLARKEAPGLEVFGGIALNLPVGGINPAAVERMTMVKGGYGLVVWLPTYDAENHVRDAKENRPFVAVVKNGTVLPEVKRVLSVIAAHKLTLETGHSAPSESLLIIREARSQGVEHIVVTHGLTAPVNMSIAQMREAANLGALIELVYGRMNAAEYAAAIKAVGPEHFIISTDLGQANNPLHPDGMLAMFAALRKEGISEAAIEQMSKANPARALGLP